MPIYEYRCLKCNHEFEAMQKFSDAPLSKCPSCGGKAKRLISRSSFQLKGSGWYLTDYAKKGSPRDIPESKSSSDTSSDAPSPSSTTSSSDDD
ncbi:MAG TPA: zinc ribbon domain-containing protein [Deltaproteobacteria bacterium]|nr:zinc ribbon domain-containing protein [Deltaproteobacteria bacterium]